MNHTIVEVVKSALDDCESRDRAKSKGASWDPIAWEPTEADLSQIADDVMIRHGRFPTVFEFQVAGYYTPINCPYASAAEMPAEEPEGEEE